MTHWSLDDAEAHNRKRPESFFIPPRERREALEIGRNVKLVFLFEPPAPDGTAGERMWVEVSSAGINGYSGVLLNEPSDIEGLHAGDEILFEARHVAAVEVSDEELGYRLGDYALVSPHLAIGSPRPDLVVREPPERREGETDSGWRLAARLDERTPSDDPPRWNDLGWLTDRFPELEPLFQCGDESGFWTWDDASRRYEPARPAD